MKRTIEQQLTRDQIVEEGLAEVLDDDPDLFRRITEREMHRRLERSQNLRLTSLAQFNSRSS